MRGAVHFAIAVTSVAVLLCVPGLADVQAADVILLGDAGAEGEVQQALENACHQVVYGGRYYEWDGVTPDVNAFDVVVYLNGYDHGNVFVRRRMRASRPLTTSATFSPACKAPR